jgi:hypothetical protein
MDIKKKSAGRPKGSINKKTLSKMTKKERDAYKLAQKRHYERISGSLEEGRGATADNNINILLKDPKTYLEDAHEAIRPNTENPLEAATPKTTERLKNGTFGPGNTIGRMKRNPWKLALKEISEEDIGKIRDALVDNCLRGDMVAIQTLFKVVIPNQKEPEAFKTLKTSNAQELDKSMDEVIAAVTSGEMDTETAMEYIKILDTKRAFIHSAVLEIGLDKMKERLAGNKE